MNTKQVLAIILPTFYIHFLDLILLMQPEVVLRKFLLCEDSLNIYIIYMCLQIDEHL